MCSQHHFQFLTDRHGSYCYYYFIGHIMVSNLVFHLNPPNQFTLTCISTGGPATTVTWTRDSVTVIEGTQTVLTNQQNAHYTHTLTITGRQEGMYKCSVANTVSSNISEGLNVQGEILLNFSSF